jgi:hypothetical protein
LLAKIDYRKQGIYERQGLGYKPSLKGQKQRRVNLAVEDFSYVVVIAENQRGFDLVTAYTVERGHKREKLRKEFGSFLEQKKEGSAV